MSHVLLVAYAEKYVQWEISLELADQNILINANFVGVVYIYVLKMHFI
jgi:hypothetical protein